MGDYAGAWRGADTRRVPSPAAKRTRRDYGDYDDVPARGTYGSARGGAGVVPAVGHEVGGYTPRGGERYDDGRGTRGGWREPDALGGTTDLLAYGAGGLGNDLTITGGPGMGMSVPGAGNLGSLGMGGLGEDPALLGPGGRMVGRDVGMGGMQGNLGLNGVSQESEVLHGGLDMLPPDASSTLFVDGLPLDCSRREAAHIFRPFIGFKEVRLVHKDAKRVVLCFVEFADARCAATALEALQGYKFDETDPDSYALRLSFARHPGPRGPPPRDETYRGGGRGGARESDYGDRRRNARR